MRKIVKAAALVAVILMCAPCAFAFKTTVDSSSGIMSVNSNHQTLAHSFRGTAKSAQQTLSPGNISRPFSKQVSAVPTINPSRNISSQRSAFSPALSGQLPMKSFQKNPMVTGQSPLKSVNHRGSFSARVNPSLGVNTAGLGKAMGLSPIDARFSPRSSFNTSNSLRSFQSANPSKPNRF